MRKKTFIIVTVILSLSLLISTTSAVYFGINNFKKDVVIFDLEKDVRKLEKKIKMLQPSDEEQEDNDASSTIPKEEEDLDASSVTLTKDPNAKRTDSYGEEKLESTIGGGAVELRYGKNATLDLTTKKISFFFENPGKSSHNMLIQFVINDTVIAQSGLIQPGFNIERLDFLNNINLSEGDYAGKMVVRYYDMNTNQEAIMSSEIPSTIKVTGNQTHLNSDFDYTVVPNVTIMDKAESIQALQNAALPYKIIYGESENVENCPSGLTYYSSPGAGLVVPKGTVITLYVQK